MKMLVPFVALLAACATAGPPERPSLEASTYDTFHCTSTEAQAGWEKQGKFEIGTPMCEVIGYYGDPQTISETGGSGEQFISLTWRNGNVAHTFKTDDAGQYVVLGWTFMSTPE